MLRKNHAAEHNAPETMLDCSLENFLLVVMRDEKLIKIHCYKLRCLRCGLGPDLDITFLISSRSLSSLLSRNRVSQSG